MQIGKFTGFCKQGFDYGIQLYLFEPQWEYLQNGPQLRWVLAAPGGALQVLVPMGQREDSPVSTRSPGKGQPRAQQARQQEQHREKGNQQRGEV